jgi:hypothetical protein
LKDHDPGDTGNSNQRGTSAPATHNYAPKEYWPSTGAFRRVFYEAGRCLGSGAAKLLERVPDEDLRLFATTELAAALARVPASSITQMKQPHPVNSPGSQGGRIIASKTIPRAGANSPTMRSPEGRLIRCPKCLFQPPPDLRWNCKMRSCLEYVLDLRQLSCVPFPVGRYSVPVLWRNV